MGIQVRGPLIHRWRRSELHIRIAPADTDDVLGPMTTRWVSGVVGFSGNGQVGRKADRFARPPSSGFIEQ